MWSSLNFKLFHKLSIFCKVGNSYGLFIFTGKVYMKNLELFIISVIVVLTNTTSLFPQLRFFQTSHSHKYDFILGPGDGWINKWNAPQYIKIFLSNTRDIYFIYVFIHFSGAGKSSILDISSRFRYVEPVCSRFDLW